jgi:hypothetical protein
MAGNEGSPGECDHPAEGPSPFTGYCTKVAPPVAPAREAAPYPLFYTNMFRQCVRAAPLACSVGRPAFCGHALSASSNLDVFYPGIGLMSQLGECRDP